MKRVLSPTRVLSAVVLAGWAGFFWWLLLSDRYFLFVGARTTWVIPAGAVCLSLAAVGRLASARVDHSHPLHGRQALAASILLLPVAATLALPPASLGALAASNRGNFSDAGIDISPEDIASGELTLIKVAAGRSSPENFEALLKRTGEKVTFEGFVTMGGHAPPGGFVLNRFVITCCVADALVTRLPVEGDPNGLAEDDWVSVTGKLAPLGNRVIFVADSVAKIDEPDRPYIRP